MRLADGPRFPKIIVHAVRREQPAKRHFDFVADRNPNKQGRYLPGIHVPVLGPEAILERQPDYLLILPWNLSAEVVVQEAEYRRRGGRFLVPIPEVRVL